MGINYAVHVILGSLILGLILTALNNRILENACANVVRALAGVEVQPRASIIAVTLMLLFVLYGNMTALFCILSCCLGVRIWAIFTRTAKKV